MKKILIRFLAILTLTMSLGSCTNFLEVRPKSSYPDYLMFSTPEGFIHAMNGAYMIMRSSVYHITNYYYGGYNQSAGGMFEYMGGGWVQDGIILQSKEANLYNHSYDFYLLQGDIRSYFLGQYRTITNLNLILKWIDDEDQNFLSDEVYCMVKGEALALKAHLLFELIQAYGPPPTSTSIHNELYIPYTKEMTVDPYKKETYTRFMELLMTDILEAEKLLEKYDPIITMSVAELNYGGDWRYLRNYKMNYYALIGLKARVQLYTGDKAGALESALIVINAKNTDGSDKFPFKAANSYSSVTDLIGVSEHMFVFEHFHVADSWNIAQSPVYFTTYSQSGSVYSETPHALHLLDRFPDAIFAGADGIRSQDLRLEKWFSRSGSRLICQKYYPLTQTNHASALPIMRKGEMLLIAAECEPSLTKAAEYLNTLREARWLYVSGDKYLGNEYAPVTFATEADRKEWIIGEYSREFIMEGRAFFAWKRMGLDKIPYPSSYYDSNNLLRGEILMDDSKYIVPVPKDETYVLETY